MPARSSPQAPAPLCAEEAPPQLIWFSSYSDKTLGCHRICDPEQVAPLSRLDSFCHQVGREEIPPIPTRETDTLGVLRSPTFITWVSPSTGYLPTCGVFCRAQAPPTRPKNLAWFPDT